MEPIEILNKLYEQEEPIKLEFHFDAGWNFCYGYERQNVYKQALQTYNLQDGFDWFEGLLSKQPTPDTTTEG